MFDRMIEGAIKDAVESKEVQDAIDKLVNEELNRIIDRCLTIDWNIVIRPAISELKKKLVK